MVTFIDYDHDGDLDIYVTRKVHGGKAESHGSYTTMTPFDSSSASVMWRNNGNGAFTDVTESTGLAGEWPSFGSRGQRL